MSNDEVERRIEEAAQKAAREKETAEFVAGLTKNDETLKPIYNPEAWVMRDKARSQALNGKVQKTGCRHPLALLKQYVDEDPSLKRHGNPVNLFECGVCHTPIWFVDPWGEALSDD